jgi:hypothetical protein
MSTAATLTGLALATVGSTTPNIVAAHRIGTEPPPIYMAVRREETPLQTGRRPRGNSLTAKAEAWQLTVAQAIGPRRIA